MKHIGIDVRTFWHKTVDPFVEDGWDPVTAYIESLIELSRSRPQDKRITKQSLIEFGKSISCCKGVRRLCANLNQEVQTISTEKQIGINLEFFGISSGLDEIVQASSIRKHLTAAWGNKLHDNGKNEEIYFPTSIISFTDKTRYLFQISKGITGDNYSGKPFEVNKKLEPEAYAVPFNR